MFGHTKGAFTGAVSDKAGFLEASNGGTVFLDEVSEIPPLLQPKLLRAVQFKQIQKLGSSQIIISDFRIISACNKSLDTMARGGKFREDLLFRLKVNHIVIPPLRDRSDDIPVLAEHICKKLSAEFGVSSVEIEPEAIELLQSYNFPGNVRELENILYRSYIAGNSGIISVSNLPVEIVEPAKCKGWKDGSVAQTFFWRRREAEKEATAKVEKEFLENILTKYKGNLSKAARETKLGRTTLYDLMNRHGINIEIYKQADE